MKKCWSLNSGVFCTLQSEFEIFALIRVGVLTGGEHDIDGVFQKKNDNL